MSFDSLSYLVFLPLVILAHWLTPHKYRWVVLLGASYLFYGWAEPRFLLLIASITLISWLAGLAIEKAASRTAKKYLLLAALACCLAALIYFKYWNFLGNCAASLIGLFGGRGSWDAWDIVLPVGISFYTFQAMSYVADVYRGSLRAQRHFGYYALYISFFPQLVAGPIERAGDLLPQLSGERVLSREDLHQGARLLLSGYFRKIVIADLCAPCVDAIFAAQSPDGAAVALGSVLFAFQIYCDFSGYSEIAAGSARMLGIRLMDNFRSPYLAGDLRDFWRRWHISLSRWFTDYVYIPLGGSRAGLARQVLATLAVFLLSGLWHGAKGTFAVWGLYHGVLMIIWLPLRPTAPRCPAALRTAAVFALVCIGWILFRAESIQQAAALLHNLFSPWSWALPEAISLAAVVPAAAAAAALPICNHKNGSRITCFWMLAAILLAWFLRLESGGGNGFIYFRF